MIIIPAVLEKKPADFVKQLNNLSSYFDRFQIDIADGQFVNNKTVQIEDIVKLITYNANLKKIKSKLFDFHLMVENYENELLKLNKLCKLINVKLVLIHLQTISLSYKLQDSRYTTGIVLNPEDNVETNFNQIRQFPVCQIMTINPGKQGSPFIFNTLLKINQLKKLGYKGKILIDGGINNKTIKQILKNKYQPDILCIGSYLKQNTVSRLKLLKTILKTKGL